MKFGLFGWGFAGAIAALIGMYVAWQLDAADLRGQISAQKELKAAVQAEYDKYKLQVEQKIADNEKIRADENAAALAREQKLQAEANRLRVAAAAQAKQREARYRENLKVLENARKEDMSKLGPAALNYLDRVRNQQRTRTPDNPAPP